PGVKFHNGDPVTSDDVKFSFERYRGAATRLLKERVPVVEVVDARHVRFRLKEPWPDFMTYYGSLATGAGWVVPKKYLEKVGDDGFKKAPIGAGPYKFVSFNPGIELVLEANEQYWRKAPSVKRLVLKAVPDESTRLAMLKRGEADVVYLLQSELAEEVRRTAGLTLRPTPIVSTHWLVFLDQWDPKSPWADRRVRLAANHAIDRQAMNDAITLGFSRITWSIIPQSFDFFWPPPAYAHDPALAKRLLAEAGYPNGFDAGDLWCEPATATMSEAAANDLRAVGIRTRLRPLERAAFFKSYQEKKLKNLAYSISGAFGNAPIRLETFVVAGGPFVYGSYPDIDGLFHEQAAELDRKRREATLHRIQQLVHDKAMYAPIWELGFIHAQARGWPSRGSASSAVGHSRLPTRTSGSAQADDAARGGGPPDPLLHPSRRHPRGGRCELRPRRRRDTGPRRRVGVRQVGDVPVAGAPGPRAGRADRGRPRAPRRRGSARQDAGPDASHPRQADRHGAARPDDVAESRSHDRLPHRRGRAAPSGPARRGPSGARAGGALAPAHSRRGQPARAVSAPAQRRHAPAGVERHRHVVRAAGAHRRRTHHFARRHHPGAIPGAAGRRAARHRCGDHPGHPRLRHRRGHRRSRRRDVRRAHRGDRPHHRHLRPPRPSVHARAPALPPRRRAQA